MDKKEKREAFIKMLQDMEQIDPKAPLQERVDKFNELALKLLKKAGTIKEQ